MQTKPISHHFKAIAAAPKSPEAWAPVVEHASKAVAGLVPQKRLNEFVTMWFSDDFHTGGGKVTDQFRAYDIRAWNYDDVIKAMGPYEEIRKAFAS